MTPPNQMGIGERLRFLATDTAIYGFGGALNRGLTLITFPLLSRHFSVVDYGLIDLLNTSLVLLVTLLVFGQDSAVARFFYDEIDNVHRRQVVSQSFVFQVIILVMVLPILWLNVDRVATMMSSPGQGVTILRLIILQAPFFLLINFSQGLLKWTFQKWQFLIISTGSALVTMVGIVVGVAFYNLTVVHVFIIYLATRAAFGLLGLYFVRHWLAVPAGWGRLKKMFPFAIPFGVICILSSVLPVMERRIVQSFLGAHELGLFAAGSKVAMLIALPINAFEGAWGPFALAIFKESNATATYRTVLKASAFLAFSMVLALTAIAEPVVRLLGSAKYEGAGVVVFAISMGLAVQALGSITEIGIVFSKRSYLKLYGYGAMILVAATAIPICTMNFGLIGVAWGSMTASFAKTIVEMILAHRVHPISWGYSGPVAVGITTLLIGMIHQLNFGRFIVMEISLVPIIGIAGIVALGWCTFFDPAERAKMLTFMRSKCCR